MMQLNNSDIRFVFDNNLQVKEILGSDEFIKVEVQGLPDKIPHEVAMEALGLNQLATKKSCGCINELGGSGIYVWFNTKTQAAHFHSQMN